jgi:hypothetical protein
MKTAAMSVGSVFAKNKRICINTDDIPSAVETQEKRGRRGYIRPVIRIDYGAG